MAIPRGNSQTPPYPNSDKSFRGRSNPGWRNSPRSQQIPPRNDRKDVSDSASFSTPQQPSLSEKSIDLIAGQVSAMVSKEVASTVNSILLSSISSMIEAQMAILREQTLLAIQKSVKEMVITQGSGDASHRKPEQPETHTNSEKNVNRISKHKGKGDFEKPGVRKNTKNKQAEDPPSSTNEAPVNLIASDAELQEKTDKTENLKKNHKSDTDENENSEGIPHPGRQSRRNAKQKLSNRKRPNSVEPSKENQAQTNEQTSKVKNVEETREKDNQQNTVIAEAKDGQKGIVGNNEKCEEIPDTKKDKKNRGKPSKKKREIFEERDGEKENKENSMKNDGIPEPKNIKQDDIESEEKTRETPKMTESKKGEEIHESKKTEIGEKKNARRNKAKKTNQSKNSDQTINSSSKTTQEPRSSEVAQPESTTIVHEEPTEETKNAQVDCEQSKDNQTNPKGNLEKKEPSTPRQSAGRMSKKGENIQENNNYGRGRGYHGYRHYRPRYPSRNRPYYSNYYNPKDAN